MAEAAGAHLDVLAMDDQLQATAAFLESLEARLVDVESLRAIGRAVEADALKIQLARDAARQDLLRLRHTRRVAQLALGRAVGMQRPVRPRDRTLPRVSTAPETGALVTEALAARTDLRALRQRIHALELERKAVWAELLPSLTATASWNRAHNLPYTPDSWIQGGLNLVWIPFAAHTRSARADVFQAQLDELHANEQELVLAVKLEVVAALAELETARGAVTVGETAVEQARETLRIERARYQAGRVTTYDLLAAESSLRRERTRRDLARIAVARSWIRLNLARGRMGASH
jgi:outer membrane protein TolC